VRFCGEGPEIRWARDESRMVASRFFGEPRVSRFWESKLPLSNRPEGSGPKRLRTPQISRTPLPPPPPIGSLTPPIPSV
jgi:hypothetical protein